jgi:hypothetical protein
MLVAFQDAFVALATAAILLTSRAQNTKFGIKVQPGPMDSILLKDYAPESSLVVKETRVAKARFPAIDVHSHSSQSRIKTPQDVDDWVKTMDAVGVETTVVFTGAVGAEFDRQAELFLSRHPGRFQVYCSLDTNDIEAPDYPQRVVRELGVTSMRRARCQ